ncbi:MAG TPA: hypothetical protein VGB77_21665 [Abditibacteriaceae bacterium]|jgi:hypothetical protein
MTFEVFSFLVGTALGVVGLSAAYIQWRQTKNVEKLRKEQLLATINRAKHLIIPNEVIEQILSKQPESEETLRQWLWTRHKGASMYQYTSGLFDFMWSRAETWIEFFEHEEKYKIDLAQQLKCHFHSRPL